MIRSELRVSAVYEIFALTVGTECNRWGGGELSEVQLTGGYVTGNLHVMEQLSVFIAVIRWCFVFVQN